jgi:hypothetical protein
MKRTRLMKTLLTCMMITSMFLVFADVGRADCPAGLTAYWKLNETSGAVFSDFTLGAHNGACAGACPAPTAGQLADGAQAFDGVSAGISVPSDAAFNWGVSDSFSIEYWIKKDVSPAHNEVAVGRDDLVTFLHWWTGVLGGTGEAAFVLRDTSGNGVTVDLQGTTNLVDGSWHHIVAVRDGSTRKNLLYVDGVLEAYSFIAFGAGFDSTAGINIGWLNTGTPAQDYHLAGAIDEVAIYGRALNFTEIAEHLAAGQAGSGYCDNGPYPPRIISDAVSVGVPNELYRYDVNGIGRPAPTFSLVNAPAGMAVNSATGEITWTPLAAGNVDVAVRAENTGGSIDQSFTLAIVPCPANIISYWWLDETGGRVFADSYGTHDGECFGDCPTEEHGQVVGAQAFSGTSTGINVPADDVFNWGIADSFSIEYWVKKDVPPSQNEVVVGRDDSVTALHWWTGVWHTGEASFVLRDNSDLDGQLHGTTNLLDGAWHHIAAVRDAVAAQILLYVDGVLEASTPVTFGAGFDSMLAPINIGWMSVPRGYHFQGVVDEVAIYGRALALLEIQTHYNDGLAGVGYCPLAVRPLPTVTIKAVDGRASEAGKNTGRFRIRRSGDTASALKVRYTIKGTAKNGKDYTKLSKSVTIPANRTSVTIRVRPSDDTIKERKETVKVVLSARSTYQLGKPRNAKVVITDND